MDELTTFRLAGDQKLDIPVSSILLVEESSSGEKGCTIVHNQGQQSGNVLDHIEDNYGFVKKKMTDAGVFSDGIELRVADGEKKGHRLYISASSIKTRRGLDGKGENGARCQIGISINCPVFTIQVLNTRDEIAGEA